MIAMIAVFKVLTVQWRNSTVMTHSPGDGGSGREIEASWGYVCPVKHVMCALQGKSLVSIEQGMDMI